MTWRAVSGGPWAVVESHLTPAERRDAERTYNKFASPAELPGGDVWDWAAYFAALGRVVQVDPIKPTLKAPGTKHLKLESWHTAINCCFQIQLAPLHLGKAEPGAVNVQVPAALVAGPC